MCIYIYTHTIYIYFCIVHVHMHTHTHTDIKRTMSEKSNGLELSFHKYPYTYTHRHTNTSSAPCLRTVMASRFHSKCRANLFQGRIPPVCQCIQLCMYKCMCVCMYKHKYVCIYVDPKTYVCKYWSYIHTHIMMLHTRTIANHAPTHELTRKHMQTYIDSTWNNI